MISNKYFQSIDLIEVIVISDRKRLVINFEFLTILWISIFFVLFSVPSHIYVVYCTVNGIDLMFVYINSECLCISSHHVYYQNEISVVISKCLLLSAVNIDCWHLRMIIIVTLECQCGIPFVNTIYFLMSTQNIYWSHIAVLIGCILCCVACYIC